MKRRVSEKRLFQLSAVCLVGVWVPSKVMGFIWPWIFLCGIVWISQSGRLAQRVLVIVSGAVAITVAWKAVDPRFYVLGSLLAIFVYSGWLVAVSVSGIPDLVSKVVLGKLAELACRVVIVEGLVGIAEAVYGFWHDGSLDVANGDWVKGTIGLTLSGLHQGGNFSNAMFATNMVFFLLLGLTAQGRKRLRLAAGLIGGLALILASVVHVLLFIAAASIGAALLLAIRRGALRRGAIGLVMFAMCGLVVAAAILPTNFSLIGRYAHRFVDGASPKGVMVKRVAGPMIEHYPYLAVFGLGPGQFIDMGALIATGQYFGTPLHPRHIPLLPKHATRVQTRYFWDQWMRQVSNRLLGSTQSPYFSWLALFGAFGSIGVLFVFGWLIAAVMALRRRYLKVPGDYGLAFCGVSVTLFLAFLGFQVDYWGIPQSTFAGFLLLSLILGYSRGPSRDGGGLRSCMRVKCGGSFEVASDSRPGQDLGVHG